jgi:hypothetical protein
MVLLIQSDESIGVLWIKTGRAVEDLHGPFADYWGAHIVVIRLYMDLYSGSMWSQCMLAGTTATQPLIEERLAGSAMRWRDEVVGDCEEESGAGRATDGEKLVSVTADGRGVLLCPFIHLHTIQELGWCFVLRSQTIVHTDND